MSLSGEGTAPEAAARRSAASDAALSRLAARAEKREAAGGLATATSTTSWVPRWDRRNCGGGGLALLLDEGGKMWCGVVWYGEVCGAAEWCGVE